MDVTSLEHFLLAHPLTFAGFIFLTIVPLVALIGFFLKWFTTHHINKLLDDSTEERKEFFNIIRQIREECSRDSSEQRILFAGQTKELRDTFISANVALTVEIRRLSDILTKHEQVLETLIRAKP